MAHAEKEEDDYKVVLYLIFQKKLPQHGLRTDTFLRNVVAKVLCSKGVKVGAALRRMNAVRCTSASTRGDGKLKAYKALITDLRDYF